MSLKALTEEFDKIQKEFKTKGSNLFKEELKQFFIDNPRIKRIEWKQYTPYFNDGDTCEFLLYEPTFFNEEGAGYGADFWDEDDVGEFEPTEQEANAIKKVAAMWNGSTEVIFKQLFGDHVKVTVTEDGIDTEEYSHD